MKNLTHSLVLCCLFGLSAQGQQSAVNRANDLRLAENYPEAIEFIYRAIVHEQTKDHPKTWFVYGQLYEDIFWHQDPVIANLVEDPLQKAVFGYNKALELEASGVLFPTMATREKDWLHKNLLRRGADYYKSGNLTEAARYFELAQVTAPNDSSAYRFAADVYGELRNYDKVIENYRKLLDLGYHNKGTYRHLIAISVAHYENAEQALYWTRRARQIYPRDPNLRRQEIDLLLTTQQWPAAIPVLKEAVAAQTNDSRVYFMLGICYQEQGEKDSAIASYQEALRLSPDYYDALYNLGVLHYHHAADLFQQAEALDDPEKEQGGPALESKANDQLRKALPYWEKAKGLRPPNSSLMHSLFTVYVQLDMKERAAAIKAEIDQL